MRQTRQAVSAINQSTFLDVYGFKPSALNPELRLTYKSIFRVRIRISFENIFLVNRLA